MPGTSTIYIAAITCLGFVCLALSAAAVGLPHWAIFEDAQGGFASDRGYFGPWKICKELSYNREKCGSADVSRFKPSVFVFVSGIVALVSCFMLGIFCILSVIQIAMVSSREKVVMKYSTLVLNKLILVLLAAILSILAASFFAVQTDDIRRGFTVTRGYSFYMEIVVIVLNIALFIMCLYDFMMTKKAGGDPTMAPDVTGSQATTYDNPGYREEQRNRRGIAVTQSSGRPYAGSVVSMNTTVTSVSNFSNGTSVDGSITSRGTPLRSSLKKPRIKSDFGIQNPGFANTNQSPSMERKASVKKVRINTHSTEV